MTQRCLLHFERGEREEIRQNFATLEPYIGETGTAFWTWRIVGVLGVLSTVPVDRAEADDVLAGMQDAVSSDLVRNVGWLATIGMAGRLAAAVDEEGTAARLYPLLAATLKRWDDANDHFARAVEQCEQRGTPTWLARTRYEWAARLLARDDPGDSEYARRLAAEALAGAAELGLAAVTAGARSILSR